MKTFYERLDFGDVYRKWYVKNPELRRAEVVFMVGGIISQGDSPRKAIKRNIDESTMERAYIAIGNYHWNMDAVSMTVDRNDPVFEEEFKKVFKKYYEPFDQKANWPILTSADRSFCWSCRFF
jgi:hypothetical protein